MGEFLTYYTVQQEGNSMESDLLGTELSGHAAKIPARLAYNRPSPTEPCSGAERCKLFGEVDRNKCGS